MNRLLERTLSLCPVCRRVIDASLISDGSDIYMLKACAVHGEFRVLYWKDSDLFEAASKLIPTNEICRRPDCVENFTCRNHLGKTTDLMLNVTDRCNYNCPSCFAAADVVEPHEPSLEEIFARLPHSKGGFNSPTVVIIGGEPTEREDLPELISGLVKRGYYPRLTTNGLRLDDEKYLRSLRDAGLEWIILQFDGFTETTHTTLRGRPLNALKARLLPKLQAFGFKIHLAVMTVKGVNLREAAGIVEFALEQSNVIWLSFYPHSIINRDHLDEQDTHVSEVMEALDVQSSGRIRKDDFLKTMKFFSTLYRLTGWKRLKPKLSTFSILVVRDGPDYFPVVRLASPWFALQRLPVAARLLLSLPRIVNYQQRTFPANLIVLNIEKFHSLSSIDLREASNCHMAFITRDGYVPFDIYNVLFKQTRNW